MPALEHECPLNYSSYQGKYKTGRMNAPRWCRNKNRPLPSKTWEILSLRFDFLFWNGFRRFNQ